MARRDYTDKYLRNLQGVDPRNLTEDDFDSGVYHDGDFDYGESRGWSSGVFTVEAWEEYDEEED